ncbi:hypothetical protein CLCR_06291 [Cladophialophora carrionii]|uniref:Fucose-specific lectin n=1 Tax=Cladophialophora carrionii TaxID=86049 RepID=A0A1C1C8G4_9EURO|nr:hypothetical protein CLCR_06291 [Cladophialophora carrionii]
MSIVPSNLTFLSWGSTAGLVYSDPKTDVVAWLRYTGTELSPAPGGQPDTQQYAVQNAILVGKKTIVEAHPGKVAAFYHLDKIRLYYIQKTQPKDDAGEPNQIRQVCYTQSVADFKASKPSEWYRGPKGADTFDAKKFIAAPDSPLTVGFDQGFVRLYYKRPNENKLRVAFTTGSPSPNGNDVWKERVAAEKF